MGKILRLISTIMIGVGLVFLFMYINIQKTGAEQVLNNPSYYVAQNYWLVFLAGIAVLAFSLMGSFFSWFKNIDQKEEVLLNAGYTSAEHIDAMLKGSTASAVWYCPAPVKKSGSHSSMKVAAWAGKAPSATIATNKYKTFFISSWIIYSYYYSSSWLYHVEYIR